MFPFKKVILLTGILLCCLATPIFAQPASKAHPTPPTDKTILSQWRHDRFGMFIHWGPVTLRGTEISWSRGKQVPKKAYDNLYKHFDPVLFNAARWVRTAKQAGMKYLVIVAKHHDGFCLWNSQYTNYDIMNTPYGKDIIKKIAKQCKKQGIMFGIYYSIADWHNPNYPVDQGELKAAYKSASKAERKKAMAKYVSCMKGQLKKLIENYDPSILWFDGDWESPWTHKMAMNLYSYLRGLKNNLIINNRIDKRANQHRSKSFFYSHAGDFRTPEQHVGHYDVHIPWESCITIGTQWAWKPNDKLKSVQKLRHLLVETAGGDGNLLLNVGPRPDGRIEHRQVVELRKLGAWLHKYGAAIYGTRGGPFKPTQTFVSTRKGHKIFLHLFQYPGSHWVLPLPKRVHVKLAQFMGTGHSVVVQRVKRGIWLQLPQRLPHPGGDSILELTINQNAEKLATIKRLRY